MDIQRVGAQELDVNVVPADVFEQDKTDPKNPVLRLRDWLLDILTLRVASATLTSATISQATVGSADITTLTTPTVTKVVNLNADQLDNHHASNGSGDIPISNGMVNTGLNSDQLDGYHAGNSSGNVPINNGTLNISLNADQLDGYRAGSVAGQIPVNNGAVNKNLVAEWAVKQITLIVSVSTILDSNACIIEVATADAVTLIIPAGLSIGHQYRIKRTVSTSNGISVARSDSETIEGGTSFTVQDSKVSATLDTGEVIIEKVSSTVWAFVGGQVSGSNSNGAWIKFSDGTMEQRGAFSWNGRSASAFNSAGTYTLTLPVAFIDASYNFVAKGEGGYGAWMHDELSRYSSYLSGVLYNNYNNTATYTAGSIYMWVTMGRWK
jgi:hypothetical protein